MAEYDSSDTGTAGLKEVGSVSSSGAALVGQEMHEFISELYPICRSITGNGVRQTLGLINRRMPLEIKEVPTGTKVFDWVVPKEWNISDAFVKNAKGEKVKSAYCGLQRPSQQKGIGGRIEAASFQHT